MPQKKKTKNRITVYLPDNVMAQLRNYSDIWALGELAGNESAIIADLITRYVPKIHI